MLWMQIGQKMECKIVIKKDNPSHGEISRKIWEDFEVFCPPTKKIPLFPLLPFPANIDNMKSVSKVEKSSFVFQLKLF